MNLSDKQLGDMLRQLVKLRMYPGASTNTECKLMCSLGLASSKWADRAGYGHGTKFVGVKLTRKGSAIADALIESFKLEVSKLKATKCP